MNANQAISNQIRQQIAAGADPLDALRNVCGAERVDAMITDVWIALRQQAERAMDAERLEDERAARPDHDTRDREGYDEDEGDEGDHWIARAAAKVVL